MRNSAYGFFNNLLIFKHIALSICFHVHVILTSIIVVKYVFYVFYIFGKIHGFYVFYYL